MTCKACDSSEGLQACLYCGHEVCALHRGELGGVAACTPCLREEHERKVARKQASAAPPPAAARPERGAGALGPTPGADRGLARAPAPPISSPPLPEPKGAKPLLAGLAAGAVAGGYGYWLLGRLLLEGPPWAPGAGAAALGLVACAGVWAIVKSR